MVDAANGPLLEDNSFKMRSVFSAAGTLDGVRSVFVMAPSASN